MHAMRRARVTHARGHSGAVSPAREPSPREAAETWQHEKNREKNERGVPKTTQGTWVGAPPGTYMIICGFWGDPLLKKLKTENFLALIERVSRTWWKYDRVRIPGCSGECVCVWC
jgi:hypothetical protein